jgi:hypothetical protein
MIDSGAALVGVGIVATVVLEVARAHYGDNSTCNSDGQPSQKCPDAKTAYDIALPVSIIGYATGGVAAAVGAWLVLGAPPAQAAPAHAGTMRCGPAGLGIDCALTF